MRKRCVAKNQVYWHHTIMNIREQDDYHFGPHFQPPYRRCCFLLVGVDRVKISGNHSTISWQLFSLLASLGREGPGRSLLNYYRHANERRLNMCRKMNENLSINVIIENKGTFVDRSGLKGGERGTPIMPSRVQLACLSEQNIGWHIRGTLFQSLLNQ